MAATHETGSAPTDELLMARVRSGDESALRGLMDRHGRSMLTFLRWMTGDRDWAESLAQDVFAAVFLKAGAFQPDRPFLPWLYSLARHAAIDFLRRRRMEATVRTPPSSRPSVDELEERERAELARQALQALPEKFRAPLILCDMEGMSYERAAEALGCSAKTLSSRLTRGRQRLRQALERYVDL